ncbi:MAG TPA: tetratricopeptide repeat protein [Ktedonosporobacter sp.]|nr:tetratricopeptide repeat protein [Ktedonosporobacter sp.]
MLYETSLPNREQTAQAFSLPQLPVQMNMTIGRAPEIVSIEALLQRADVRLLTLTGPGGVGKTRLALEVARIMGDEFPDGIFFVSLAPLQEADMVLSALAQALGIEEVAHYPLHERLMAYIAGKQLLIVLDNFEHVLEAGTLIAELLSAMPLLKVLVTSREVLHLYGEHEFEVMPLALPDLTDIQEENTPAASIQLFVERAQAVRPTFVLTRENRRAVAEICLQLDGLPLAIELAAARVKILTPQEISIRLQNRLRFLTGGARNLPVRQQTLRNLLDWSYSLLTRGEQHFFRRLGVLIGSWTNAAAESVGTSEDGEMGEAFDLLSSLVDKSLVRVVVDATGETRFTMLETMREYALDCLEKGEGREKTERRHVQFFLSVAEEAEQYLNGREQQKWLQRLDREAANLWRAMRWVIAHKETALGLRLAAALIKFLQLRGSLNEGHSWLEEILTISETVKDIPGGDKEAKHTDVTKQSIQNEGTDTPMEGATDMIERSLRARVLYGAGVMAQMHNNLALARKRLAESKRLAIEVGDRQTQALTAGMFAVLELHQGNYEAARKHAADGIEVIKETDDKWCRGMLHSIYGKVESKQCHFDRAQTRYHVSLMLLQEVGDLRNQADVMVNLGHNMRLQGKLRTAHFLYSRSSRLFQEIDDRWSQATCLNGIGDILRLQGRYAEAQAHFEECLALTGALGNKQEQAVALTELGQLAIYQGDMQRATRCLKESLRLTREIGHTQGIALLLLSQGDLERIQGKSGKAASYYEQCLAMTRTLGDKVTMASALFGLGNMARIQQHKERACRLLKQGIHLCWEIGDRPGLAAILEVFAWFCRDIGIPEQAVQLLGTTDTLREDLQISLTPNDEACHKQEIARLREEVGEAAFQESWSYGKTMSLKLAISMVARINATERVAPEPEKQATVYPAGLTAREVDVLRLVAAGLTDARIAEKLVLSARTVNTHLRSIYAKLDISSRSAATRFAVEHGLI